MNVANRTDAKHLAVPMKDRDGRDQLVVIAKVTYRVDRDGGVERDDDGPDPHPVDVPNGDDPATSSIRVPSDLVDYKPGTDVLLVGDAQPRGGATYADVSLRMGPIAKVVRAHGLRVWQRGMFGGVTPGPAMPIREPVPLIYELAWGGLDLSVPERPVGEPRNYLGRGVARSPGDLVGKPAAALELPTNPIGERNNVPASFGAIHRHWQPRAAYAGTYDAAWEEVRMPLLPRDFDPRFNVCVPHDQWSQVPLFGDEPVEVLGATREGVWRFRLPREGLRFSSLQGGARREHRTHLDTVLIDAATMRVELTWRAAIPVPQKLELLDEVRISRGGAPS
jgi:hypothetical protein